MLKVKNKKEFNKWRLKKKIAGSTPRKKKRPENKADLIKVCDNLAKMRCLKEADYKCSICGQPASTAHHFVFRSQSFLLRWDRENLISVCMKCHYKFHHYRGQEMTGILIGRRGQEWFDRLMKIKSQVNPSCKTKKFIKDKMEKLTKEIGETIPFYE